MTTDVLTGNTYDKYGFNNPVERKLMGGFFDALDSSLPDTAPGDAPRGRRGRGRGQRPAERRYPNATIVGLTCPTTSSRPTGGPGASTACAPTSCSCRSPHHFDLVMAIEVLEHVSDPPAALAELARLAAAASCCRCPASRSGGSPTSPGESTSARWATPRAT